MIHKIRVRKSAENDKHAYYQGDIAGVGSFTMLVPKKIGEHKKLAAEWLLVRISDDMEEIAPRQGNEP